MSVKPSWGQMATLSLKSTVKEKKETPKKRQKRQGRKEERERRGELSRGGEMLAVEGSILNTKVLYIRDRIGTLWCI